MKKIDINALIQLLGMVGIIISLIFVALEMRQSQMIAQAGQNQERMGAASDMVNTLNEVVADFQSLIFENNTDYKGYLSEEEIIQRNLFHIFLFTYENDHFQYSRGLMPEEVWSAKLSAFAFFYNNCEMRPIIEARIQYYAEDFLNIIRGIPDECSE
jgi:MFS superfamily sulfate permease-like transporter